MRFHAGTPLAGPNGEVVGALCLVEQQPHELSATDPSESGASTPTSTPPT